MRLVGGCHCGALAVSVATGVDLAQVHPRACDCSFCMRHGAAYFSDPSGTFVIKQVRPGQLSRYRQGAGLAQMLLCRHCGVLLGAILEDGETTFGTLNVRCLSDAPPMGEAQPASPQKLSPEAKLARWHDLWFRQVRIESASASTDRPAQ